MNIKTILDQKMIDGSFRHLQDIDSYKKMVEKNDLKFINFSSNDYLGLASDLSLQKEFLNSLNTSNTLFTTSSSRLLTGNTPEYISFEEELAKAYKKEAALLFNCGYHANSGLIPALTDEHTLILADKLIHASMVDGIKLSNAHFLRYRHNDYNHLENLIKKNQDDYTTILVITESLFSMDGDKADLQKLVHLKRQYPMVQLYVDEAHGIGVYGPNGLGCCEASNCIDDIDYIVGTFGKALASCGAFVVCSKNVRDWLVNSVRPFIFTTALPPINVSWSQFIFNKLPEFSDRRNHLEKISSQLRSFIKSKDEQCTSTSQIIPFIIGENNETIQISKTLQKEGLYVLPIRPPSVPVGSSRLRLSLCANHSPEDIEKLIRLLGDLV